MRGRGTKLARQAKVAPSSAEGGLPTLTVKRQLLQMEPESNYYAEPKALVVCDFQEGPRGRKFLGVRQHGNPSGNKKTLRPRVRRCAPRPYGDPPLTSPRQTNKQTNKQLACKPDGTSWPGTLQRTLMGKPKPSPARRRAVRWQPRRAPTATRSFRYRYRTRTVPRPDRRRV